MTDYEMKIAFEKGDVVQIINPDNKWFRKTSMRKIRKL